MKSPHIRPRAERGRMADTTARKFHHVAMLMGGWSAEREVSLSSGTACAHALEAQGYKGQPR